MKNIIFEDSESVIFEDYFEGTPIRFVCNKLTNEIKVDAQAVARCLGYASFDELLSTDEALDGINEIKKEFPGRPLFGEYGSGAILEKTHFKK